VTDRPDNCLLIVAVPGDGETERRKPVSGYRRERKARTRGINQPRGAFVHATKQMDGTIYRARHFRPGKPADAKALAGKALSA
jgi:hypothetical protein